MTEPCTKCGSTASHHAPDRGSPVYAVSAGCAHGVHDWQGVREASGIDCDTTMLVAAVGAFTNALRECLNNGDYPHSNWGFFAILDESGTPMICGVEYTENDEFVLRWDACEATYLGFHSSMKLFDWAMKEFIRPRPEDDGSDPGTVISLN